MNFAWTDESRRARGRKTRHKADQARVRRAFAHPNTGRLIGLESRRRLFPAGLRKALIVRYRTCRTPWCDAPTRHADHLSPHAHSGATSLANGDGLCEACNHAKQAPGYTTRTPTGHTYHSTPPALPGHQQASTNTPGDLPKAS